MRGGAVRLTDDGALVSGRKVRIFGLSIESGSGGNGNVVVYEGADASGSKVFDAEGEASKTKLIPGFPAEGLTSDGVYATLDANATAATFFLEVED